ncbi:MAG: cyclic nucleotide-binding domain-containing protein [Rhizobiaceae bacterium]
MRASDLPDIRSLKLFASMTDNSFEDLIRAAYLQNFPGQLELIREGDPADFLYIVLDGSVELFGRSNGRESSLAVVKPIGSFILAAVLKDAVYLMSARTLEHSKLLMIPSENVRNAFNDDENFSRAIVEELANCYRSVVKEHKSLKLRTAVERLANRLLKINEDQGNNGSIELPYDKKILASLLGMTPENLSRAFNTLKPYGVRVDGPKITLDDIDSLLVLAKPNKLIDDRNT